MGNWLHIEDILYLHIYISFYFSSDIWHNILEIDEFSQRSVIFKAIILHIGKVNNNLTMSRICLINKLIKIWLSECIFAFNTLQQINWNFHNANKKKDFYLIKQCFPDFEQRMASL